MATKLAQVEERLHKLEAEVREIKTSKSESDQQKPWHEQILGMFDDDPGFDKMIRLGKAIRDQDRGIGPTRRKRVTSRKDSR